MFNFLKGNTFLGLNYMQIPHLSWWLPSKLDGFSGLCLFDQMVVGLVNLGKFQLVANGWFAFIHKIKYRHVFTYMHRYIYIKVLIYQQISKIYHLTLPKNKQKKTVWNSKPTIKNLTKSKKTPAMVESTSKLVPDASPKCLRREDRPPAYRWSQCYGRNLHIWCPHHRRLDLRDDRGKKQTGGKRH